MPSALPTCTKEAKEDISTRGFQFYKDTEEFYSTLTTTSGLEGSLKTDFSLGLTLDLASRNVGGTNRTVTGNSLLFVASYRQDMLEKKCLTDDKHFDKEFLEMGSIINQMAFAETEDFYTERDFQVKSCISLGVPLDALFGGCSGIDKSEILRVSKMSMRGELVIKGGTTETRNELINKNRTADLIEKFMNEANATNAAIQYSFTSIWDILQSLYVGKNNNNFVRAVNLEFYYLGFLNYGCYYKTGGGQDLQMFNFTQSSTPTSPQYECTLAPDGCHGSSDCWHRSFHPCAIAQMPFF
ncbi:hypothetical protein ACROYT_G001916 [Oculina patagonica]